MNLVKELEDELNTKLKDLYNKTSDRRVRGENDNAIQPTLDKFMSGWFDKLNDEQEKLIGRTEDQAQDTQPELVGGSLKEGFDRARLVNAESEAVKPAVEQQIAMLRDGMIKAVLNIGKGQEPGLVLADHQEALDRTEDDIAARRQAYIEKLKELDKKRQAENEH